MRSLTALALLALLPACVTTIGNGNLDTEARDVDTFTKVTNATQLEVVVRVNDSSARAVDVTCDSNVLDYILTEVRDHRLVIKTEPNVILTVHDDCSASIMTPELRELAATGSGDVYASGDLDEIYRIENNGSADVLVSDIAVDDLRLRDTGSGAIIASGTCDTVDITNTGSGDVDARDLFAVDATVTSTGSGNVSVRASGTCDVTLTGSGNVDIYGDPVDVIETNTGSGTVGVF